jgi:hypothetical protein
MYTNVKAWKKIFEHPVAFICITMIQSSAAVLSHATHNGACFSTAIPSSGEHAVLCYALKKRDPYTGLKAQVGVEV